MPAPPTLYSRSSPSSGAARKAAVAVVQEQAIRARLHRPTVATRFPTSTSSARRRLRRTGAPRDRGRTGRRVRLRACVRERAVGLLEPQLVRRALGSVTGIAADDAEEVGTAVAREITGRRAVTVRTRKASPTHAAEVSVIVPEEERGASCRPRKMSGQPSPS